MKRRKFIEASLLTAAAPIAVRAQARDSGRLYGTPASVAPEILHEPKLTLPLVDAGVPTSALEQLSKFSAVWRKILGSADETARFSSDPLSYLEEAGFGHVEGILTDENVILLSAVGTTGVRESLIRGDYERVFSLLTRSGVLHRLNPRALSVNLAPAFEEQRSELLEVLSHIPADLSIEQALEQLVSESFPASSNDSLVATVELVRRLYGEPSISPSAVVPVIAIAIAAILVSVGVSFTVATGAAIVTSVVAMTEITVGGATQPQSLGTHLDPQAKNNFRRILKIAGITGDRDLLAASTRELIVYEVKGLVGGFVEAGLLDRQSNRVEALERIITGYALNVAGLSK